MNVENGIEVNAAAPTVWVVFTDVEGWPEWTASVQRVVALDGPGVDIGKRFEIKQPGLPPVVWEVTEVRPGAGWTWRYRQLGATVRATHEVEAHGPGRTAVRQRIEHRGPLGVLSGLLMLRRTRRYLQLEAAGLKARTEQMRSVDGPSA